jgi:4-hydroxy 2-oxovalerate aldolase
MYDMKEISNLMNYRDSIKVVDATLRDGGLVNDFFFTDKFVHDLYLANIKAGVDYMEFGYKGDKEMFDKTKFGKWKFCDEDDLRAVVGDNDTDLKIAVMADVGRCNYKEDIIDRNDSVIDLIRVATYLNQIPTAVDMIENAKNKGYEVSCNIMAISTAQEGDLRAALDILGKSPVDVIYIVDSFGAMYPEQMQRLAAIYVEFAEKYGKKVGIHAHNNQQLAFANTIEAVGDGVDWLDATYASMGRGAGNCAMELLLGFLKNPKYNVFPVIKFIDEHMTKMREQGVVWGYDLQYLMTGLLNQHPRTAIAFTKDNRNDYAEFYKEIVTMD